MLTKLGLAAAAASTIALGVTGIAFAGDFQSDSHHSHHKSRSHHKDHGDHGDRDRPSVDCSNDEVTKQYNSGRQLIGGNLDLRNVTGLIGGAADKVVICPSIGNNNDLELN